MLADIAMLAQVFAEIAGQQIGEARDFHFAGGAKCVAACAKSGGIAVRYQ